MCILSQKYTLSKRALYSVHRQIWYSLRVVAQITLLPSNPLCSHGITNYKSPLYSPHMMFWTYIPTIISPNSRNQSTCLFRCKPSSTNVPILLTSHRLRAVRFHQISLILTTPTHSVCQGRITKRYSTEVCWDDVLFHLCSIVLVPKLQGKVSRLIEGGTTQQTTDENGWGSLFFSTWYILRDVTNKVPDSSRF